ncbi:MAG: hypothetical protein HYU36_11105 [Planctomycetes bacterium]|nr:hypothetical protein [Planctomycetota bacterium]
MRAFASRFFFLLAVLSGLAFAVTFFYGFHSWPNAPLRQVGDVIQDKQGNRHTEEDYRRFLEWQRMLLVSAALAFGFGVGGHLVAGRPGGRAGGTIHDEGRSP